MKLVCLIASLLCSVSLAGDDDGRVEIEVRVSWGCRIMKMNGHVAHCSGWKRRQANKPFAFYEFLRRSSSRIFDVEKKTFIGAKRDQVLRCKKPLKFTFIARGEPNRAVRLETGDYLYVTTKDKARTVKYQQQKSQELIFPGTAYAVIDHLMDALTGQITDDGNLMDAETGEMIAGPAKKNVKQLIK